MPELKIRKPEGHPDVSVDDPVVSSLFADTFHAVNKALRQHGFHFEEREYSDGERCFFFTNRRAQTHVVLNYSRLRTGRYACQRALINGKKYKITEVRRVACELASLKDCCPAWTTGH